MLRRRMLYNTGNIPEWVEVGGVKWATRNIDMPGIFAKSIYDHGMLYKFNNNIGWPSSGNISADNPASDGRAFWDRRVFNSQSWLPENSPWPDGWRLGSPSEFTVLRNCANFFDVNKGYWFANVASDLGNPQKSLFIPFVGHRKYNSDGSDNYGGEIVNKNIACDIWTSQSYYYTALAMRFYRNEIASNIEFEVGNALPVRCVKI